MTTHSEDTCVMCMNELFLNPSMKLMIAVCSHKMCDSCVTRTFLKHVSIPCPDCKIVLKKNSFVMLSVDDSSLDKENAMRKRIMKIYNKRLEDFGDDLNLYNDYLEEVEDIIYNFVNAIDVDITNEKVKKYERENQQQILHNQARKTDEDKKMNELIQAEDDRMRETRKRFIIEDQDEQKQRLMQKIEAAAQKNPSLKLKLKAHKEKEKEKDKPKTAPTTTTTTTAPPPTSSVYKPSAQAPLTQPNFQPQPQALGARPLAQPKSAAGPQVHKPYPPAAYKAGGYKEQHVRMRAIEEAFAALVIPKHTPLPLPSLSPIKLA